MFVFAAEALPLRLVGVIYHDFLDACNGLGLLIPCDGFHAIPKAGKGSGVHPPAAADMDQDPVSVNKTLVQGVIAGPASAVNDNKSKIFIVDNPPAKAVTVFSVFRA